MLETLGHFLTIQSILVQLKNLNDKRRDKNINIAIFGTGGVGKSVLGCLLSVSDEKDLEKISKYYRSRKSEEKSFKSESHSCALVIPPGQEEYKDQDWEPIYKNIEKNEVQGLINIVAWGYNSPYSFEKVPELEKFNTLLKNTTQILSDRQLKKYLENNREEEIKRIESLVDEICRAEKLWMITLIAKEDLWWNKKIDVINYYKQGKYNNFIEQIKTRMRGENFHHEYVSASLLINNLITAKEERILAMTTAGYTANLQEKSVKELLEVIESCLDRFNS